MLIIFDVDGTLIGGEAFDWKCFNDAFETVTGKAVSHDFWLNIEEVTARAVVHQALSEYSHSRRNELENRVGQAFLENLQAAHQDNPSAFRTPAETIDLLEHLKQDERFDVGIATGDWFDSIAYKLKAASIDLEDFPHATASDTRKRADIIRLAAQRAGRSVDEVIYVGDGVWDLKACRELDIPFIGTGNRSELLIEAGARWTLPILDTEPFLEIIGKIQARRAGA